MTHGPLAYIYHDPVVAECCDNTYSHDTGQLYQISSQAAEIIGTIGQHRRYVIIYQCLGESSPYNGCNGRDQNTDDNKQKRNFVIMQHISDDPADQLCS